MWQWLSPPVYPHATKQFYELFEKDETQYDGAYALLVRDGIGRGVPDSVISVCLEATVYDVGQCLCV